MGGSSVIQQGTLMKQLVYFVLIAACALVAPIPGAMAGGGGGGVFQEEDEHRPILSDVDADDEGGCRPEWADPNPRPSEMGGNEDPTPFNPSDPVGILPNQD